MHILYRLIVWSLMHIYLQKYVEGYIFVCKLALGSRMDLAKETIDQSLATSPNDHAHFRVWEFLTKN